MWVDRIKSGIGGELGDGTIQVVDIAKPLWKLNPLPLSQINPAAFESRKSHGRPSSLQHYCLQVISRNLEQYDTTSFDGLPSILIQRIFNRVKIDRHYTDTDYASTRPDETTIWTYHLLNDVEGVEADHTLAIPISTTLSHFKPQLNLTDPVHPFISIPRLYSSIQPKPAYHLITSLRLDGMDGCVNDQTILNLKWATHLTVLWTVGCIYLSDIGIKLLESCLVLPGEGDHEGKGMWRLRCWYLNGCKQVGDKSMKSFARWPGLVLLDVRNTSCTSAGIGIFNRTNEQLFRGRTAVMQSCTTGLRALFGGRSSSEVTIQRLAQTILPIQGSSSTYQYRSLNLISSHLPLASQYLPDPTPSSSKITPQCGQSSANKGTYRADMGNLYGSGVSSIRNETLEFRHNVKIALYMDAARQGLTEMIPREGREALKRKQNKKKLKKEVAAEKKLKKGYKLKENDRRWLSTNTAQEEVSGEKELMLVRMSDEGWEKLKWETVMLPNSQNLTIPSQSQRVKRGDLLADILGTSSNTSFVSSQLSIIPEPSKPTGSGLFRPKTRPAQSSSPSSSFDSSPITPIISTQYNSNPFKSMNNIHSNDVKPLDTKPWTDGSIQAEYDLDSFDQIPKKRRFGGIGGEETKRRGMKMFSASRI